MPSIIFNAIVNKNLDLISSDALRDQLRNGAAYSFASHVHGVRNELESERWNEIIMVYTKGLNVIWWVALGISIAALVGVAGEKDLELRNELETEYGIDN